MRSKINKYRVTINLKIKNNLFLITIRLIFTNLQSIFRTIKQYLLTSWISKKHDFENHKPKPHYFILLLIKDLFAEK